MRSNSGLERFHRSSICHRSLSATSFRAVADCTGATQAREAREARAVSPTLLGGSSWFDWAIESSLFVRQKPTPPVHLKS